MFKQVKNSIRLLKSTFAIALISLSSFVTTSCSGTKKEKEEGDVDQESSIINVNSIIDNDNCRVNSSLFPVGSSYKLNELDSDIVLGVNEIKNCDVTEVTITFSSKSTKTIKIKIENGQQTSDKKYDGITFQVEKDPQEFEGKVFSKVLRLKKDALKKIINDLNSKTSKLNISFDFNKVEKEPDTKTKIHVGLRQDDDQVLRDAFKGIKLNDQDDNWYAEDEHEVVIDELSSISIAYEDNGDVWASDDQQFFIRKVFENEFDDDGQPKFIDEPIQDMTSKNKGNVTTFELKNKIPILGDVYLIDIHSEYIQPNVDDFYTINDKNSNNTIFLLDESVETDARGALIKGFYFDAQGKKQTVEYERQEFNSIVNVGKNITFIGDHFLDNCPKIEYVNFENGFANIHNVGMFFMSFCEKLKCIQINGEIDKILTIGSNSYDTTTEIGSYFLYSCPSFNQEIKVVNNIEIGNSFLWNCENFDSNITFELDYVEENSVNMKNFMYNCKNMKSTITINAPSNPDDLSSIFDKCDEETLSVDSETDNSYVEGIKIDGKTAEHINAFMSLVPNSDSGPYYRKLVSVKD